MPDVLSIEFVSIDETNISQLRALNASCFPIQYNEAFYKEVAAQQPLTLSKFAYYNGLFVGAVCTRLEAKNRKLYIMTLGVLAAYRGRGIGTKLIQSVLDYAKEEERIDEIYLHVQTNNHDAMHFYESRFEFIRGEKIENYYRRIDPPDCYILYKMLK